MGIQPFSAIRRFDVATEGDSRWEREIIEPEDEYREGLYTVRTRVNWSTRGKERFEEIVTWHYVTPEEE